ncbi:MAG: YihY/virulence factor BrkB family protein, partial [Caldilineaceae bacterium]
MKQKLKTFFDLLKQTFKDWQADHAPRLAAALAYYTAFSLAPLLVIAIAIAGLLLGPDQVKTQVLETVSSTVSADAADLVGGMIDSASKPKEGLIATVLGVITLTFGAIGAFGQLQSALDAIWDVEDRVKPGGILGMIRTNLLNFGMVVFVGFLLLVSLVVSTMLAGVGQWIGQYVETGFLLQVLNALIGFAVITLLFALIYKVLPHTEVAWRDVWVGTAFTAVLFTIGRYVLNLYLVNSGTAST